MNTQVLSSNAASPEKSGVNTSSHSNGTHRQPLEKRHLVRMPVDSNISFTTETGQQKYNGRCRNLSGTGLLLETSKKLKVGSKVNISVPCERRELPNLEALAEVVRVNQNRDNRQFEIGLAIKTIF